MILHLIVTLTLNVREFQDELATGNRNLNKSTSVLVNQIFRIFNVQYYKNDVLIIFYIFFILKLCKKY